MNSKCKDCIHLEVCSAVGSANSCGDLYKPATNFVDIPVEVGQTVWYIEGAYYNSVNQKPRAIVIHEINKKKHGKTIEWGFVANCTRYKFSSIGKSVFLSEKAALEHLAKKKKVKA